MNVGEPSRVRILFDDGVCEEVDVSFVGECLCRLEQTPLASTTEARLGDVVEFEPEDGIAKLTRIAERSPYEMLTLMVPATLARSERFREWLSEVERQGCRVEQAHGGVILVHAPGPEVEAIRRAFGSLTDG